MRFLLQRVVSTSTDRKRIINSHANAPVSGPNPINVIHGWAGLGVIAIVLHNAGTFDHARRVQGILVATLLEAGWVGIPLLLLLAGFVATGVLLDAASHSGFRSGLYGRAFRHAAPVYFLTLIVAFVLLPHLLEPSAWTESVARSQFWYWTLLKSWVPSSGAQIPGFEHIWVLSDGWPILLIWPVLARLGAWRAAVIVAVGSIAWRGGMLASGVAPAVVYHSAFSWFDAVGLGSLVAVVIRNDAALQVIQRFRPVVLVGTSLALVMIVVRERGFPTNDAVVVEAGTSLVELCFAVLIISTMIGSTRPDAWLRGIVQSSGIHLIGMHAFAIYLLHFPLHRALITVIQPGSEVAILDIGLRIAYALLVLVLSTLLAVALGWLFDWTARRLEPIWSSAEMESAVL